MQGFEQSQLIAIVGITMAEILNYKNGYASEILHIRMKVNMSVCIYYIQEACRPNSSAIYNNQYGSKKNSSTTENKYTR